VALYKSVYDYYYDYYDYYDNYDDVLLLFVFILAFLVFGKKLQSVMYRRL